MPPHAQVRDLAAGGVPNNRETAATRQIKVAMVDTSSPASGILAVGGVFLGADGPPGNTTVDANRVRVVVTISSSEAASGKLFGRLLATPWHLPVPRAGSLLELRMVGVARLDRPPVFIALPIVRLFS